ncbi:WD40-repeat-containing domain protein [Mycena latifolia]|nr:WD40-repeat-containing domain protein [Mycena latifolia]
MFFHLARAPSTKNGIYVCHKSLQGHIGPIETLGATADGKLLASGGADGTLVWDLQKMRQLRGLSNPGSRGATTAILWVRRADDPGDALFYGTQGGYIVCWRQGAAGPDFVESSCVRMTNPGEVTGLAFDAVSSRVAVCNRKGIVQMYSLDADMNLRLLYSRPIPNSIPKAIAFGEMNGNERDVMVFSVHSGHIYILRLGQIVTTWDVGGLIGDGCVDSSKTAMCIGDPVSGVDIYRLQNNRYVKIKSFKIEKSPQNMPRAQRVCFANENSEIVGGSDHGVVYVFDWSTGETLDELRIDPSAWVQTVTAAHCNGVTNILTAKSGVAQAGASNEIYVWRRRGAGRRATMSCDLMMVVHAITLLVTVAFLYQNIGVGGAMAQLGRF